MKLIGKIIEIQAAVQASETFKKRVFVVEYAENPAYPEYISFELVKERCELLDKFQPGHIVQVSFDLKGNKWVTPGGDVKYFNTVQAWQIKDLPIK